MSQKPTKTEIYANLNAGGVSIKQGGRVQGIAAQVRMSGVEFKITRPSEQKKARATGQRNVHAAAIGEITDRSDTKISPAELDKLRATYPRIRYNVFERDYFHVDNKKIEKASEILMVLTDRKNENGKKLCELFLIR